MRAGTTGRAIQQYYDEGHTVAECRAVFGFSSESWHSAIRRGELVTRPRALSIEELCVKGVRRGRYHLRARLIAAGVKTNRCERCGITSWRGQPITIALHHVNGDPDDNRLENLQLLCPNCHSQTENFSGRNRSRAQAAEGTGDGDAARRRRVTRVSNTC